MDMFTVLIVVMASQVSMSLCQNLSNKKVSSARTDARLIVPAKAIRAT